jgi:mRNA interferase MazF
MTIGDQPRERSLPLRGEVWDAFLPQPVGDHPVVVLTSTALIPRLRAVTVAIVTGTEGPLTTHVPLDPDAGVTKYPVSWANAAELQTLPTSRLRRPRGRLAPAELDRLEACVRAVLVL